MTTAIETPKRAKPSVMSWMISIATLVILVLFFTWLSQLAYFAKDSAWVVYQAKARTDSINAEIAKPGDHPWAGAYYRGDGLSHASLTLAPQAGFVYELYGCLGPMERLYGKVTPQGDRLQLSISGLAAPKGFLHREYISVSWGARRYLIPPEEILRFCRDVNTGYEPRESMRGWYLLRRGDDKKPATGLPQVPMEFQSQLRTGPVLTEIEAVKETRSTPLIGDMIFKRTAVSLKGGREQGLRPGMVLSVMTTERFSGIVKVAYADPFDPISEAVVLWSDRRFKAPEVGWKLSSDGMREPKE